jgi:hypothetical protein
MPVSSPIKEAQLFFGCLQQLPAPILMLRHRAASLADFLLSVQFGQQECCDGDHVCFRLPGKQKKQRPSALLFPPREQQAQAAGQLPAPRCGNLCRDASSGSHEKAAIYSKMCTI